MSNARELADFFRENPEFMAPAMHATTIARATSAAQQVVRIVAAGIAGRLEAGEHIEDIISDLEAGLA